jgi:hypothetical protein
MSLIDLSNDIETLKNLNSDLEKGLKEMRDNSIHRLPELSLWIKIFQPVHNAVLRFDFLSTHQRYRLISLLRGGFRYL